MFALNTVREDYMTGLLSLQCPLGSKAAGYLKARMNLNYTADNGRSYTDERVIIFGGKMSKTD